MAELSYRVCQFASTAVTSLLQGESRGAAAPSARPWGSCTNSSLGWGGLRPDLPLPGFLDTSVLRRWSLMSRSHTSFPSLCGMCPSADKTHLRSALSGGGVSASSALGNDGRGCSLCEQLYFPVIFPPTVFLFFQNRSLLL